MKKITLTTLTLLVCFSSFSQSNYIDYFNSVISMRKLKYEKKYLKAMDTFTQLEKNYEHIHATEYCHALDLSLKLKDYKNSNRYVKNILTRGYPLTKLEKWYFDSSYLVSKEYNSIKDSIPLYETAATTYKNNWYAKQIDSLYYIDQSIVRNAEPKRKYPVDTAALHREKFTIDSIGFVYLLHLIDSLGFPSEELVGYEARNQAGMMIHHNFRMPPFQYLNDFLIQQLKKGYYLPREYAWAYDQGLRMIGEKVYYYYATASLDGLTEEQLNEIDRRRKLLGIDPLESTEIIKKPSGGIRMNGLW